MAQLVSLLTQPWPTFPHSTHRGVAQLVERCFWEAEALGSSPSTPTQADIEKIFPRAEAGARRNSYSGLQIAVSFRLKTKGTNSKMQKFLRFVLQIEHMLYPLI